MENTHYLKEKRKVLRQNVGKKQVTPQFINKTNAKKELFTNKAGAVGFVINVNEESIVIKAKSSICRLLQIKIFLLIYKSSITNKQGRKIIRLLFSVLDIAFMATEKSKMG